MSRRTESICHAGSAGLSLCAVKSCWGLSSRWPLPGDHQCLQLGRPVQNLEVAPTGSAGGERRHRPQAKHWWLSWPGCSAGAG